MEFRSVVNDGGNMQDSPDLENDLLNQTPDTMGGEPLEESGFESEDPDPSFVIGGPEVEE